LDPTPYFAGRQLAFAPGGADLRGAFALRYSVYCLECHFLDPRAYPDGLESDADDRVSAHFAAYDLNRELVGYVRLVPPGADGRLPWESRCKSLREGVHLPPRARSAEISRLMVREDYRRRRGDLLSGVAQPDSDARERQDRRSATPQILLTLYRQMYRYSLANGISHWYAAMERSLARSLKQLHFGFHQIGAQADYFGPVAPFLADLGELESQLALSRPDLLAWMQAPNGHEAPGLHREPA
jgi:N-acyl amino acid synthase of PEP-CTERM/exosortase system